MADNAFTEGSVCRYPLMVAASGGDLVRLLANERFHNAVDYVPFIAGGVFFYGTSQLALSTLILVKQFKWGALWWFISGVAAALINLILVPMYGGLGAAITQCISFAIVSLGILFISQLFFRLELDIGRLSFVIVIILISGFLMTPAWHIVPYLSLLFKMPIGLVVAAIVVRTIAPDWYLRGMSSLGFQKIT